MPTSVNGTAATAELDQADQCRVLQEMITEWRVARYQLEVRSRVAKKIGDPKEHLNSLRKELERAEKAIDALQEELRLLDTPAS